jgi:TolB-like protein/Tfp pilus assembly protein PilF
MSLFAELKRRNVFRVGAAYAVAAWVLLQVLDVVGEILQLPPWGGRLILALLVAGFVLTLIFAWAYELTPEGLKRESEVDRSRSAATQTGRRLNRVIILTLVLALALFAADKFLWDPARDRALAAAAAEQARSEVQAETAAAAAATEQAAAENSIAVLPFADMSPGGDQQYFSDGIAEELLNALVRVDGLEVASRTSSFAFRGDQRSLREIAQALGVSHILEGSVRRAGDRVRITAQLIEADSDRHLWSETFDRDLDDVLAVQGEIANAIVSSMKDELGLDIRPDQAAIAAHTGSADAYDLYLQGRALILARSEIDRAIVLLEQAVAIDPGFAKAWEVLGAAYYIAPSWGFALDGDSYARAVAASERALELDPGLALPWSVLGQVGLFTETHNYRRAIEYDARALAADPNGATVHLWAALNLADLGYTERAIARVRRCLEIDPAYGNCRRHLAFMEYMMGREDAALDLFRQGAEAGFRGNEVLFLPLILRRQGRAAAAYLASGLVSTQGFPVGDLLDVLEFPDRDHSAARQRFRAQADSLAWSNLANRPMTSAFMGQFDLAAIIERDYLGWVWSPDLKAFRRSPEFKTLVRERGLLSYWRDQGFPPFCQARGADDFACE